MAVTAKVYSKFHLSILGANPIQYSTDAIKIMLCTSAYTPLQNTHQFKSDVTSEVSGTGYTATGNTLGTKTAATATTVATFDAADTSWAASTITARYAVVYDSTPASDATRPLICYIDFGADVISSGGTFTITFDALGIWTMTVA
jgi:hypothetical protein